MNNDYLSVDEAAKELDISRATMWVWIRRNSTPTFRMVGDRRTLLKRSDLDLLRQPMPTEDAKKAVA